MSGLLIDGQGRGQKARLGGGFKILKIYHTSRNDDTWHSYNLLKEDPKNI